MSFAGQKNPLIERGIAATASRGILMVAAAGNAGAKSPPLYPAANPNVIAVSGTDAQEKLFAASNRGNHIAISAPGADIFLPAPDEKYQITSGTSFSAAYVSGVAALLLDRKRREIACCAVIFAAISPSTRLKKSPGVLNVRRGCCDLSMWERLSLPIGCIRRERPSTPSAPYGLTRPVVPPDGSFILAQIF